MNRLLILILIVFLSCIGDKNRKDVKDESIIQLKSVGFDYHGMNYVQEQDSIFFKPQYIMFNFLLIGKNAQEIDNIFVNRSKNNSSEDLKAYFSISFRDSILILDNIGDIVEGRGKDSLFLASQLRDEHYGFLLNNLNFSSKKEVVYQLLNLNYSFTYFKEGGKHEIPILVTPSTMVNFDYQNESHIYILGENKELEIKVISN